MYPPLGRLLIYLLIYIIKLCFYIGSSPYTDSIVMTTIYYKIKTYYNILYTIIYGDKFILYF